MNFCKFTNETRFYLEELSRESRRRTLCALNGTASGGGYELALACEEILLVDDGSSAVSLPEVPLLGVLPGTGGLTRVVDKRKVRRDHADFFATTAEGVRGKRARASGSSSTRSCRARASSAGSRRRAAALAAESDRPRSAVGIALPPLDRREHPDGIDYRHVALAIDRAGASPRSPCARRPRPSRATPTVSCRPAPTPGRSPRGASSTTPSCICA